MEKPRNQSFTCQGYPNVQNSLNDQPLSIKEPLTKLNDSSTNHDNLRNLETDLALPRPKTNFLKRSFSIVVQCVGTIFLTRQNCTIAFRI